MSPALFVVLAALVAVLYYFASCWWFPLVKCWCCHGSGTHDAKNGRHFRRCWMCRGQGSRFRRGRKIWNHFRNLKDKAVG